MAHKNTEPYAQSGESLHDFLSSFWQRQVDAAEEEVPDYRHPPLPLARIKKVMKSDPDVKQMIAADAPILLCKACEKITSRAFIVADANKRRTLSRGDIAKALTKSDQFDFLIDIVPRDDRDSRSAARANKKAAAGGGEAGPSAAKQEEPSAVEGAHEPATGEPSSAHVMEQLQSILNMQPPPV